MYRKTALISIAIVVLIAVMNPALAGNKYNKWKYTNFGAGLLVPADAAAGPQLHFSQMKAMDQTVRYGLGLDVYFRQFEEKSQVSSLTAPTGSFTTYEMDAEYNILMFSPQFILEFQVMYGSWRPYARTSAGIDLLFSSEKVYFDSLEVSDSRFYMGLGFNFDIGNTFKLGDYTDLTAFAGYHWGSPRRGSEQIEGLPAHEEIKMSGLRFGLKLSFKYD